MFVIVHLVQAEYDFRQCVLTSEYKDAFRRQMCLILMNLEFPSLARLCPISFCAFAKNHLAQRLRSIAETMIKAQLINWFQAIEIKIRSIAFVLPPITPKKNRNMSRFFWQGYFFCVLSLPSITAVVFVQIRWSFMHADCYGSPACSAGLRSASFCP